ncbi:MAG: PQQ-dependent sugar dehydrogenase [Nibricoccus sp.]
MKRPASLSRSRASFRLVRSVFTSFAIASTALSVFAQYTAITLPAITAKLEDFATAPATGASSDTYIARVNFLRTQPGDANRLWVNDSSGRLYILDADDKEFHTLLNFNGTAANGGLFAQMYTAGGYSWGLVTFQFHPQYAQVGAPGYGKFYTVHVEIPTTDGAASRLPATTNFSGFNATGYTTTNVQVSPGTNSSTAVHCVLIEWQDTDVTDYVFTGTAREILRTENNSRIHPLGDLLFNPLATSSAHPDWENLYLAHGDGADGEQADATKHANPQSLAVLVGKILRINVADPDGAGPLRYGIPADNPFVATGGARGEIWAYGFRNPHRFSWDVDPATPTVARLFVNDIGFHDAEEVNIVTAGANHGWADREGLRASASPPGLTTVALPGNDATFNYTYPVVSYPHSDSNNFEFGDAISSGYVYRGSAIPALQGKYVFGDITTARLFYANLTDLDAANDGNPATVANVGVINLRWDDPDDSLGAGLLSFDYAGNFAGSFSGGFAATPEDHGLFTIIVDTYRARGGTGASHLPGGAASTDIGRADVRWAMDASGELFLLSKSDGMIRRLVAAPVAPAVTTQPADKSVLAGVTAVFNVAASGVPSPTYQWQRKAAGAGVFADLSNDSTYSGVSTAALSVAGTTTGMSGDEFRCVATNSEGSATSASAILGVARTAWHLAHFSAAQLASTSASGDAADPDGDGVNNLLEYAFDLDPYTNSAALLPQSVTIAGGTKLRLEFDQLRSDVTYTVQVSTDLLSWDDDVPDNPNLDVQTSANHVTAIYTIGAQPRAFMRVVATTP